MGVWSLGRMGDLRVSRVALILHAWIGGWHWWRDVLCVKVVQVKGRCCAA
jgi:hypothetical protein